MTVIGGFRSALSITRKTDGNFTNVSAAVLFSKVANQGKRWYFQNSSIHCRLLLYYTRIGGSNRQVTGHESRATGHGSQVEGHRSRVTGSGSRVTGRGSQVTGCRIRVTDRRSWVTGLIFSVF